MDKDQTSNGGDPGPNISGDNNNEVKDITHSCAENSQVTPALNAKDNTVDNDSHMSSPNKTSSDLRGDARLPLVTSSDGSPMSTSSSNGPISPAVPGAAGAGGIQRKSRFSSKLSSVLSHLDFQHCDAEIAINMMRSPNIKVFSALNRKLRSCDSDWMNDFLEGQGFEVLFDAVETLSTRRVTQLSDAMLLLECVACIRTVMNSQSGMDYFISHPETSKKLVKALDTNNGMVKKQVFELLSALSVYTEEGYQLTLTALDSYKVSKKQRYRFSLVMNELKANSELPGYWATVLGFINCLILANTDIDKRVQLRNEFIGLHLVELVQEFEDKEDDDEELQIQCDVFQDELHTDDEELMVVRPEGLDITDHNQVYSGIFKKICDRPQSSNFLSILQCLLQIEDDEKSDRVWSSLEDVVRKTVYLGKVPPSLSMTPMRKISREERTGSRGSSASRSRSGSQLSDDSPEVANALSRAKYMQQKLSLKRMLTTESVDSDNFQTPPSTPEPVLQQTLDTVADVNDNICEKIVPVNAMLVTAANVTRTNEISVNEQRTLSSDTGIQPASILDTGVGNGLDKEVQESIEKSNKVLQSPSEGGGFPMSEPLPPIAALPPSPPPVVRSIPPSPPLPPIYKDVDAGAIPPAPPAPPAVTQRIPPPPPPPPPSPMCGGIPPPPPPPPMCGGIPPPPPPPPPPMCGGIPPPPPPPPMFGGIPPPPPPPPGPGGIPPPPPPFGGLIRPTAAYTYQSATRSMGIETPKPKSKMKTINWTKVPASSLSDESVVWKEVLSMQDPVTVKYEVLEGLFSQKIKAKTEKKEEEKKKEPKEINLLDMKRSMNVNIFLKQFKASNETIMKLIKAGDETKLTQEQLKGLLKQFPEDHEKEMLTGFDGDQTKLGNAENFLLQLIRLPAYQMRVEGMLMKAEFQSSYDTMLPDIEAIAASCKAIMESHSLKEFLRYALHTGNFINAGGYAGNALGFKIGALSKLIETRANKPRMTLLHYLVEEAEKENKEVIQFVDELLPVLDRSNRLTVDGINAEVKQWRTNVTKLANQLQNAPKDVREQLTVFVEKTQADIDTLQGKVEEVEALTDQMAQKYCEDKTKFKVEECLDIYKTFCENIHKCQKENANRKLQEERAERRKKEQQTALANKSKGTKTEAPPADDGCLVDKLLAEVRRGTSLRRTKRSKLESSAT